MKQLFFNETTPIALSALTRHCVVLGSTGSGKSVLMKELVLQAWSQGTIPVVIDPHGDLVPLVEHTHNGIIVKPGSNCGMVTLTGDSNERWVSAGVLARLVCATKAKVGETQAMFARAFDYWSERSAPAIERTLSVLAGQLLRPTVGLMNRLERVTTERHMANVGRALNSLLSSPRSRLYTHQTSASDLVVRSIKEGRFVVVYTAHLDKETQHQVVTMLAEKLFNEMKTFQGREGNPLKVALCLDEISGMVPPVAEPPVKKKLMALLKEARKFGLGLMLGTQSPGDLDYKALAQCNTWFVGRMGSQREFEKVRDALLNVKAGDPFPPSYEMFITLRGNLSTGEFLVRTPALTNPVLGKCLASEEALSRQLWDSSYVDQVLETQAVNTVLESDLQGKNLFETLRGLNPNPKDPWAETPVPVVPPFEVPDTQENDVFDPVPTDQHALVSSSTKEGKTRGPWPNYSPAPGKPPIEEQVKQKVLLELQKRKRQEDNQRSDELNEVLLAMSTLSQNYQYMFTLLGSLTGLSLLMSLAALLLAYLK